MEFIGFLIGIILIIFMAIFGISATFEIIEYKNNEYKNNNNNTWRNNE